MLQQMNLHHDHAVGFGCRKTHECSRKMMCDTSFHHPIDRHSKHRHIEKFGASVCKPSLYRATNRGSERNVPPDLATR